MTTLNASAVCGGYATADFIVKGVDITVAPRDLAVIIGPNGAGKSTFLKLLAGLLPKRTGEVSIDGTALPAGDAHAACERGVSFVLQERNVFGSLSVQENLEMGGYLLRSGLKSRIEEQLSRFPMLRGRLRDKAGNLSGGQRQVLAVAVALMTNPSVLLLDEPTAGLSPAAAKDIFVLIRDLAASGLAILMVEQNALLALEYGTRGIVLVAGKKVLDDASASVIQDDEIRHLFLGRAAPAVAHRH
ncbi:ABC transporter ATP-binding protein [Bradyrhizobium genosp. P]|uniref:ABC transporter ATP-binding protein n=1 Tax=Bradyrhizobium genosp. P TaxID=83641 RepID=UPI003CF825EC